MSENRETQLTWATEADFRKVQRICLDNIPKINWKNNVTYPPNVTGGADQNW